MMRDLFASVMALETKLFDFNQHYEAVSGLWAAQGYPVIPKILLPKHGVVAFDGGIPLAACWLTQSIDTPMGILAWTVGNKAINKDARGAAIRAVVSRLIVIAKELGMVYVKAIVQNPSLEKHYLAVGAELADKNISQVGWRIS